MTVIDFLRLTRRSWRTLVVFIILAAAAMAAYSYLSPKVYEASSEGFIVAGSGDVISGSQDAVDKISAYLSLISTTPVFTKIAQDPTVDLGGQPLAGRLSASVVSGSTMIQVTASAPTPESALALANGGLKALAAVIHDVEVAAAPSGSSVMTVVPLQNAVEPSAPSSPHWKRNIGLGALAGLILGYLFVFARRGLETRIRSKDELGPLMGVGLLGAVPRLTKAKLSIDATDRQNLLAAESIRQVRTGLSFSSVDRKVRSVAVTSANEQEGKTTVATALAEVFARSGRPTLVIDADLRRPAVARQLGVDASVGLSELLSGQAEVTQVIRATHHPDLFVLPAGHTPPNPSEMLGSDAFRTLLAEMSEDHFVIVDAPPLLPVTDASLVAAVVDGVVFVAVAGKTRKPAIAASRRLLEQVHAHTLGVVLNMVPLRGIDSASYGYYGKKYGYANQSSRSAKRRQKEAARSAQETA